MSTDFTGRESDKPITEQEGAMFAAQPVWERSRKRKGFGGRRAVSGAPSAVISRNPVRSPPNLTTKNPWFSTSGSMHRAPRRQSIRAPNTPR